MTLKSDGKIERLIGNKRFSTVLISNTLGRIGSQAADREGGNVQFR